MKTITKRLWVALVVGVIAMCQAVAQDAFYIYRNDGNFNAFFRAEVDSITYSCYNADSLLCAEWQTQVIHTPDSVYRIPLAVIDSVAFTAPEVILQENVTRMEDGLLAYLRKIEVMDLTFDSSLPQSLYPKRGDVLICTDFNHPILGEGFAGKVIDSYAATDGYKVLCDTVYDITEIFEQLISIEPLVQDDEGNVTTRGTWSTAAIPVEFALNYDASGSDVDVKMYGGVSGTVVGSVIYNFSKDTQYLELKFSHNWGMNAGINISHSGKFFKMGAARELTPLIRFPAALPLFKFQLFAASFVRGSGSAELDVTLSGGKHGYVSSVAYHNGVFRGSHSLTSASGSNAPEFSSDLSLSGMAHFGMMLGVYLGTIEWLGYVKASVDLYMGPKVTGDFSIDLGSVASLSYYGSVKDSKVGLSLFTADVEVSGEATYFDKKIGRHTFFDASFPSPIYNEWYLFPEFSDIEVSTNSPEGMATLSCYPSRNVLLPLTLGYALYDKYNKAVEALYSDRTYKQHDSGYHLNHTFASLLRNKLYTARPLIRFAGGDIPASPSKEFTLDCGVETGEASNVTQTTAVCQGRVDVPHEYSFLSYGVCYSTSSQQLGIDNSFVSEASPADGNGSFSVSLSDLKADTKYYYRAYLAFDDKYFYGVSHSFTTKDDAPTPGTAIDLGLSVKWASYNVGASSPEGYGGYYAWGELEEKSGYYWDNYQYWDDNSNDWIYIGSNISGTDYDVAHVKWGDNWRMPTFVEIQIGRAHV